MDFILLTTRNKTRIKLCWNYPCFTKLNTKLATQNDFLNKKNLHNPKQRICSQKQSMYINKIFTKHHKSHTLK